MNHETQVRQFLAAKKPGDALIYLAKQLDDLAADGFGEGWDEYASEAPARDFSKTLERLGERPSDPEDAMAWDARRRLAEDDKKPPTPDVFGPPKSIIERAITEHSIEIKFPAPTEAQAQARQEMVERLKLDNENWFQPHIPPCAIQYIAGGPVWLYLAYRQYMETLPRDVIHAMILDVFEWSPGDAEIISADLMRRPDDDGAAASRYDIALSNLQV